MSEKKGGEQRSGGAEERRSGGAEEEERTDNFWIQRSRNPTQNFVHPAEGRRQEAEGSPDEKFFTTMHENSSRPVSASGASGASPRLFQVRSVFCLKSNFY
ncbi:MAG: hypothetical protein F6K41_02730 [Symploca sp. SIO3E6]|nr:hypothetical protein [Caldora sp. SIO3E6]